MKEKLNNQLLYLWKKESYVRKLKKSIENCESETEAVQDEHYESLVRNVKKIMTGEQTLVVPPSEEERRSELNVKFLDFLQRNPSSLSSLKRFSRPSNVFYQSLNLDQKNHQIDPDLIQVEQTWKQIHAQSAAPRSRSHVRNSTMKQRALTARDDRRSSRFLVSSLATGDSGSRTPRRAKTNLDSRVLPETSTLTEQIEVFLQHMDSLQKNINTDLVDMRSIRRDKGNPDDLKTIYESRRKICEINRHATEVENSDRKSRLMVLRSLRRIRPPTPIFDKKSESQADQEVKQQSESNNAQNVPSWTFILSSRKWKLRFHKASSKIISFSWPNRKSNLNKRNFLTKFFSAFRLEASFVQDLYRVRGFFFFGQTTGTSTIPQRLVSSNQCFFFMFYLNFFSSTWISFARFSSIE